MLKSWPLTEFAGYCGDGCDAHQRGAVLQSSLTRTPMNRARLVKNTLIKDPEKPAGHDSAISLPELNK